MSETHVLRGFAQRESDGSWFAICIDVNIYARAASLEDVKRKLDSYVTEYIEEACGVDRDHFHDLVPRRAPLIFRIRYHMIRIAVQIQKALRQLPQSQDQLIRKRMLVPGC